MKTNEIEYFEEVEGKDSVGSIILKVIGIVVIAFAVWFTLNYVDGLMASMIK